MPDLARHGRTCVFKAGKKSTKPFLKIGFNTYIRSTNYKDINMESVLYLPMNNG